MASQYSTLNDTYEVTHSLDLDFLDSEEKGSMLIHTLGAMPGILSVTCDWRKGSVTATYDLRLCHIRDIEAAVARLGCPLKEGFFPHLHHGMVHYMERNEESNATYRPRDVTKVPPTAWM